MSRFSFKNLILTNMETLTSSKGSKITYLLLVIHVNYKGPLVCHTFTEDPWHSHLCGPSLPDLMTWHHSSRHSYTWRTFLMLGPLKDSIRLWTMIFILFWRRMLYMFDIRGNFFPHILHMNEIFPSVRLNNIKFNS